MQMRKGNEGQGTARSASKSPGKKQSGEQASSTMDNTTANQEANQGTGGQGMAGVQGTSGTQGTSRPQQGGEQDLLQHAKDAGGEIMHKVQERAGSQLNRQKETAATEISHVANAVRRIRESLPGGEESGALVRFAGEYGDKAANSLERLSNYIREQDPKQLLDDVQNFGRRRPALLLGGAFLLGFAGARLIKSSMDAASSSMQAGYRQPSSRMNTQGSNLTGTNVSTPRPSTGPNVL
jgi:hypothetical protein